MVSIGDPGPVANRRRHLKVLVDSDLAQSLATYARERQLSVSDAVRLLLHDGLEADVGADSRADVTVLPALAFANLIATEHILRLQMHHHPRQDWLLKLPEEAAEAARQRLEEVELAMQVPGRRSRPWPSRPRGLFGFGDRES